MRYKIPTRRFVFVAVLILIGAQACLRVRMDAPPALPEIQEISTVAPVGQVEASSTSSAKFETPTAVITDLAATQTILPVITITAIKGNLFIRRGPDMAFNPIGVLYENSTAVVIGRDVLSKWVQIIIPDSQNMGWVSTQTDYSKVAGDLSLLPDFTPTEWPLPAYIRNCTHHQMYILPGEITLPSTFETPENEIWLYPGRYNVYDLDVPGEPEVLQVDMREGLELDIRVDGLGEKRKCP